MIKNELITTGKICSSCETIMAKFENKPQLCQNCINIQENLYETVQHNHYVRCPKCHTVFNAIKTDLSDTTVCPSCENKFNIEFYFQSPPVHSERK